MRNRSDMTKSETASNNRGNAPPSANFWRTDTTSKEGTPSKPSAPRFPNNSALEYLTKQAYEMEKNSGGKNNTSGSSNQSSSKSSQKTNISLDQQSTILSSGSSGPLIVSRDTSPLDISNSTKRLAREIDDFINLGLDGSLKKEASNKSGSSDSGNNSNVTNIDCDVPIADLQLNTARKLRQLIQSNPEILLLVKERKWIPLLLQWLHLHDRPAVQIEALLVLTNIAEVCAQSTYYSAAISAAATATNIAASATKLTKEEQAAVAAAQAAAQAAAAKAGLPAPPGSGVPGLGGGDGSSPSTALVPGGSGGSNNSCPIASPTTYPYPPLLSPTAPGQVPFPPLSFSQPLSPEAMMAFDVTLTNTIQQHKTAMNAAAAAAAASNGGNNNSASGGSSSALTTAAKGGGSSVSPSSFPPPPGAGGPLVPAPPATSSSGSGGGSSLPPPTPVPSFGGTTTFPQNLSASSLHLLLRHADAIPTLISVLSSPKKEVYEQAMWILGSIAAGDSPNSSNSGGSNSSNNGSSNDGGGSGSGSNSNSGSGSGSNSGSGGREKSVAARDVILAAGVMNQLLRCLEAHPSNLSLQRIGSWTLSNLVDGLFQQSSHKSSSKTSDYSSSDEIDMVTLLPVLRRLSRMADAEVLSYTCWTLSHLCDGPSSHIAAVVTTPKDSKAPRGGLVPRLVELLLHPSWRVTKPALRTIGNIVCAECSDDNNHTSPSASSTSSNPTDYTEIILECEAVPRLKELVTHSNREIQKEACWTLSNIAAGTVDQIQAVIDSDAIPPLVKLVSDKNTDQEVRSEACWVVLNATSCGSDSQIEILVDEGCVSVLGVLLGEASMVMMALEGLERVLQVEEARESARREQIESGEIDLDELDDDEKHTPSLVSASLIEKALDKHNSSAVTKRANRIWKQHFVSCALCKNSFSKHRTSDATFCDECKCYVCCKCDCRIYHLSYQEELWAVDEEKEDTKKSAKKSKKQKKKEKQKQKKQAQKQQEQQQTPSPTKDTASRSVASGSDDGLSVGSKSSSKSALTGKEIKTIKSTNNKDNKQGATQSGQKKVNQDSKNEDRDDSEMQADDDESNQEGKHPPIDFVSYLQQTGSIIALAKLMDALEYGTKEGDDLDDIDVEFIKSHQQYLTTN